MNQKKFSSWGGYKSNHIPFTQPTWSSEPLNFPNDWNSYLPHGFGRSYGDSPINSNGGHIVCTQLNKLIDFDLSQGILTAESGVQLGDLARWSLNLGFFLPVSPGTQFVSLGGAVANDIHGKNHHLDGSFGNHVIELTLARSNGDIITCSPTSHSDLFFASIGGLGLTGFITKIKLKLKKASSPYIDQEQLQFSHIDEAIKLSNESQNYQYVVSWFDCLSATKAGSLKGILYRGNHSHGENSDHSRLKTASETTQFVVPCYAPSLVLNKVSIKAFNTLFYTKSKLSKTKQKIYYQPFFYPLDAIHQWNLIYGKKGFHQYQFVVPLESSNESIKEILFEIKKSGQGSFLAVLKIFGTIPSQGMLSFPRPGLTLALDFKNLGKDTLTLLTRLDEIVFKAGGALYPAKDQRMSSQMFQHSFPKLNEFKKHKDPKFSSDFWRRVNNE